MAVCSEIHTKLINTVCGQNVELLSVKLEVHIVTTGIQMVKMDAYCRTVVKMTDSKVSIEQATCGQ